MPTTLLLVAHGSRVEAAGQAAERLRARVAERHEGPVLLGFLELADPLAMDVVGELEPAGDLIVQPLLLLPGNHATFDVSAVARAAAARGHTVRVGQALGSDVRLLDVATEHLQAVQPVEALLVIASGTASDAALRSLDTSAALVASGVDSPAVAAAPATLDGRRAVEALGGLAAAGHRRVVVLPWMLFPGRLEQETTQALQVAAVDLGVEVVVAERFGPADGVVQAVLRRAERARPLR